MDTPSSEQLKPRPGSMHANKFTGQNFEGEMVMATMQIENIVNDRVRLTTE